MRLPVGVSHEVPVGSVPLTGSFATYAYRFIWPAPGMRRIIPAPERWLDAGDVRGEVGKPVVAQPGRRLDRQRRALHLQLAGEEIDAVVVEIGGERRDDLRRFLRKGGGARPQRQGSRNQNTRRAPANTGCPTGSLPHRSSPSPSHRHRSPSAPLNFHAAEAANL